MQKAFRSGESYWELFLVAKLVVNTHIPCVVCELSGDDASFDDGVARLMRNATGTIVHFVPIVLDLTLWSFLA